MNPKAPIVFRDAESAAIIMPILQMLYGHQCEVTGVWLMNGMFN